MGSRRFKPKKRDKVLRELPQGAVGPADHIWFDVAPGWACQIDGDHILLAHQVDPAVYAIPLATIRESGVVLPRLDDLKYRINEPSKEPNPA